MTPSGGDSDIVGALNNIVAAISGGGGGGMPADYPFETETLFDGSVEFVNTDGSLGDIIIPDGATLHVTVASMAIDLSWDSDQGYWHDENNAIILGNGAGGDPAWISVPGIPDGSYSVSVKSMAIDENFRSGVEACAQSGPTSNVPNLPDSSETQAPQYIGYHRFNGWQWMQLKPAPVPSMAAPYSGVVEGAPAAFAKFPGHLDNASVPSSMSTTSLYMLAYKAQPSSGDSQWGVREIHAASSFQNVDVNTTYTLKLRKTDANSYIVEWVRDAKYVHNIHLYRNNEDYYFTLITNSGAAIGVNGLVTAITNAYGNNAPIPASGRIYNDAALKFVCSVYVTGGSWFNVTTYNTSGGIGSNQVALDSNMQIEDLSIIAL